MWKYFEATDDFGIKAKCKLCSQELSYRTNTSNLKKHLMRKHTRQNNNEPMLHREKPRVKYHIDWH
nr:unnamed protein product [Callosobruchus analis]